MRLRRLPLALLAPVSLLVLVVALGALQYRWVGQVREAEREQMKQSLDRRSSEFADDFDREIGRAFQQFRPTSLATPGALERFAGEFDEWQATARFPGLIKTAYLATLEGRTIALQRYRPDARTFESVVWPEPLEPVRARLSAVMQTSSARRNDASLPTNFLITAFPVLPEVPALVIAGSPVMSEPLHGAMLPAAGATTAFKLTLGGETTSYLVLELDRAYLASTVLPAIADRHFPESGADRFRMSVTDGKSQVLLSRGVPNGQALAADKADAAAAFFGIRLENIRGVMTSGGPTPAPKATMMWSSNMPEPAPAGSTQVPLGGRSGSFVVARAAGQVADELSMVIEQHSTTVAGTAARSRTGWTLLLQHNAGSLDAAVDRIRLRNLWLSFGILSVLAASAFLVMVNARRSEKLAAQQLDFVATVSHELRTPVAVIRSAAQNLAAGVVHEPEQARRYGNLIDAEGRRLTDMVEQVLEYAGLSDTKRLSTRRPVDTASLVRDVVAASESLPEAESLAFEVRIDDDVPAVMAEEDSIRRALLNLIGNAMKHAADGGWIGVTVARGTGKDDGQVAISVADRGQGIPPGDLTNIFKPFYRGEYARHRQIHGNGLGLSLVKRVADAHDGRITVTSAPGEGSTFTLTLPISSSKLHPATDSLQAGSEAQGSRAAIADAAEGHSA